jgi:hypothetical protein
MASLESKVPPPAIILVMALFMWLIARAAPSLHFEIPAHNWLALLLVSVGFVTGILGVVTFRKAKTTVNPLKPHASSLVTWGVYAILAIRCTWAVSSCSLVGQSSCRTRLPSCLPPSTSCT